MIITLPDFNTDYKNYSNQDCDLGIKVDQCNKSGNSMEQIPEYKD